VYIFPRPLSSGGVIQDGGAQIKAMMSNLINNGAGDLFTSVWIDVEGGDLYWSRTLANNVKFIEQMLTAAKTYQPKYQLGIYTSASQWAPIVGSSYTGGAAYPLWYASYNNQLNFNDFKAFAGWTVPTLHQYAGDKTVCGVGLDQNLALFGTLSTVTARAPINGGSAPWPLRWPIAWRARTRAAPVRTSAPRRAWVRSSPAYAPAPRMWCAVWRRRCSNRPRPLRR